MTTERKEKEI